MMEEGKMDKAKELYDIGEKLCHMAKAMGYSPESDSYESEGEEEHSEPYTAEGKSKVKLALGFLK